MVQQQALGSSPILSQVGHLSMKALGSTEQWQEQHERGKGSPPRKGPEQYSVVK